MDGQFIPPLQPFIGRYCLEIHGSDLLSAQLGLRTLNQKPVPLLRRVAQILWLWGVDTPVILPAAGGRNCSGGLMMAVNLQAGIDPRSIDSSSRRSQPTQRCELPRCCRRAIPEGLAARRTTNCPTSRKVLLRG